MSTGAKPFIEYFAQNHSKSNRVDDFHIHTLPGGLMYYHHDGNRPREFSYINDNNIQQVTGKGTGSSEMIHKFMNHYVNTRGTLKSDTKNTHGSRKLWIDFIKKHPEHKFHYEDSRDGSKTPIDHSNIDQHKDKIWSSETIRVVAQK